ncbi:MAG: hypothetical protein ACLSVD_18225 [Eggerthellaceae bacterium]
MQRQPPLHRKPGPIGAAFDHSGDAELTPTGCIHPSMVRLCSPLSEPIGHPYQRDSMMATASTRRYSLGGQDVTVRATSPRCSGTIAGSATDLMACARRRTRHGHPLDAAVRAASANPARALGLEGSAAASRSARSPMQWCSMRTSACAT